MKKNLPLPLVIVLIFMYLSLSGQVEQSTDLTRLYPGKQLPQEFMTSSKLISESQQKDIGLSQKDLKRFYLKNDYAVSRIVKSARLLFDDPVSEYLGNVLDNILEPHPELKGKIKIYAYRSTAVNAFMMPNGMLFVTLGLLANATTEADLAFVLSHEIIHFTQQHSIDMYVEGLNSRWKEDEYVNDYLDYHHRSRQHELEADEKGINDFFLKTRYNPEAISRTFDILQYGHLPYEELTFKRDEVEDNNYHFKDSYFLNAVNAIKREEAYLDTLSSHPNTMERRMRTGKMFTEDDKTAKKDYIQGEEKFRQMRDLARFECINQYLVYGKYVEAFFNIRVLERDHPDDINIKKARVGAFYGLAKVKQAGMLSKLPKEKNSQGEMHGAVRFFRKANSKELTLLALREAWEARKLKPDDEYLGSVCRELMQDLFRKYKLELTDFSDFGINDTTYKQLRDSTTAYTSKYDAVKVKTKVLPQEKWKVFRYMLVDLKKDPAFTEEYKLAILDYKETQLEQLTRKKLKVYDIKKAPMTFIVMEPGYYLHRNPNREIKYKPGKGSVRYNSLRNSLKSCPATLNITSIPVRDYTTENGTGYRGFAGYRELVVEMKENEGISMMAWASREMYDNSVTGDARYIVVLNQASIRSKFFDSRLLIFSVISVLQYPFLPIGMYNFFTSVYSNTLTLHVLDIQSGNIVYSNLGMFEEKLRQDYVNDFIYRSLYDAKKEILSTK